MDSLPYLELLKKCLLGLDRLGDRQYQAVDVRNLSWVRRSLLSIFRKFLPQSADITVLRPLHFNVRQHGKDEPLHAPARMGLWRLHNLEVCARQVIQDHIPGDFMETGAWRGGGGILLRGVLHAHGISGRSVWVVDDYTVEGTDPSGFPTVKQVEQHFCNYDLLDDQVHICAGLSLKAELPAQLALVRIGEREAAEMEASLRFAYDLLQPGGYLQIDRYYEDASCREVIDRFRREQAIDTPLEKVDWSGVFWRKPKKISTEELPDSSVQLDFTIQQHASEKQNFFHHVWGYLLPALHHYLTENTSHLLFHSGGPYMDPVTIDFLNTLEVPYTIVRDWEVIPERIEKAVLPRWEPLVFELSASPANMAGKAGSYKPNNAALVIGHSLPGYMAAVRQFVLKKVLSVCTPSIPPGAIIILDRADENALYRRGGLARANTYGKGHRALHGIPKVVDELTDRGISVLHYPASKHTFTQQITDFYHCGGVVGIRGAEFAHLIWMQPGTKVLMYQPSTMNPKNIQKPLAELMGLSFRQIDVDSNHPELRISDLLEYFDL